MRELSPTSATVDSISPIIAQMNDLLSDDRVRYGNNTLTNAILKKLEQIYQLPDDWDSYGSPSLSKEKCDIAREIIFSIVSDDIPEPAVVPAAGGGVQFEWDFEGRSLEIEVIDKNTIVYLKEDTQENMDADDFNPSNTNITGVVNRLIRWLMTGAE